jgi:hypothetical protein
MNQLVYNNASWSVRLLNLLVPLEHTSTDQRDLREINPTYSSKKRSIYGARHDGRLAEK